MSASDQNFPKKVNCECYCCKKYGYPKHSNTGTSSIWHTRNNSSNVSSLLAPDVEEPSEKSASDKSPLTKPIAKITLKSTISSAKGSEITSPCGECYCRQAPNLSRLSFAGKNQDGAGRSPCNLRRNINCKKLRKPYHGVKRISKEVDKKARRSSSEYVNKIDRSNFPKNALNMTSVRNNYESKMRDLNRIEEAEEKSETQDDYKSEQTTMTSFDKPKSYKDSEERQSSFDKPKSYKDFKETETSFDKPKSYKDFKELGKFRKEQYFDTHSTNDLTAPVLPQHKCVHKFVLDNRLLPQPMNSDSYGTSHCDVCYKPMEAFKNQRTRSETDSKSVNKIKQIYEYNLAPHKLNIGSGKEAVQIRVPECLGREILWHYNNFKIKRKVPGNSFALRYQRGRV